MAGQNESQHVITDLQNVAGIHDDSMLTPAQRCRRPSQSDSELDESQTCVMQVYTSTQGTSCAIPDNGGFEFGESYKSPSPTDYSWPILDRVKVVYRNGTKDEFIAKIILEADSKDERLEEIRSIVYQACLALPKYPFPKDVELKRRKKTRKGESVSNKLANDIYLLLCTIENGCYDGIKDILSLPRSQRTDLNMSVYDNEQTSTSLSEIALLKDMLTKSRSDILALKQDRENFQKSINEDIKGLKTEIGKLRSEIYGEIADIRVDIERIEDEKTSGIVSLKNTVKLISEDVKLVSENTVYENKSVRETVCALSKKVDKNFQKLDSKVSDLSKLCNKDIQFAEIEKQCCVNTQSSDVNKDVTPQLNTYKDVLSSDRPSVESHVQINDHSRIIDCDPIEPPQQKQDEQLSRAARDTRDKNNDAPADQHESRDRFNNTPSGPGRGTDNAVQGIPTRITSRSKDNEANKPAPINQQQHQRQQQQFVKSKENYRQNDSIPDKSDNNVINDDDDDDFTEFVVQKTKRFYLGGFKSTVKTPKLVNYVKNRGLKVTMLRVFGQGSGRSVTIRLNVESKNSNKLIEPGFWPKGVICRPWLSKSQYLKTFRAKTDVLNDRNDQNDNDDHDDDDLSADIVQNRQNRRQRYNPSSRRSDRDDYDRHHNYGEYHSGNADHRADSRPGRKNGNHGYNHESNYYGRNGSNV